MNKYLLLFLFSAQMLFAQKNLIPKPQISTFESKFLNLKSGVNVKSNASELENKYLANILNDWKIETNTKANSSRLSLEIKPIFSSKEEAYELNINEKGIFIFANSTKGIFYGLKTLEQFDLKNKSISYAKIQDEPAFSWRGFLVDVGRNFQPVEMLKEQIDVMARYKLNVFHFHFTEDLAWRLQSKKYPGLTDASIMERWKGSSYSENDMKELIKYCQDRHILFLPEIDMPGHSKAFKRFFKVDMQSEQGIIYIKELLKEFRETYPELDYLHIGGDEVKITNRNFMPEITKYVEDLGYKKTVGWDPGSNLEPQTIRQMWMGGSKKVLEEGKMKYIESKHLYINHMDPLETVTTLFYRKIAEQDHENSNLLGATLCVWPDRAVSKPEDMFLQNAIYPSLITFGERAWKGGGEEKWHANIFEKSTVQFKDFEEYESRMLTHQKRFLVNKPFPYKRQSHIEWELIGPFDNEGDLEKSFEIERNSKGVFPILAKPAGGTVILHHWFTRMVQTAIENPKNNSTVYARTKIWSDKSEVKNFWLGSENLSRSYASDSPELGTWDKRNTKFWVNGKEIMPPKWKQAGAKGEIEKPLIDEGYSFRAPTEIVLKKGWNEVLIKLPVKDLRGKDWQNPVKWMFTFLPID